jgi:hypothetical protein
MQSGGKGGNMHHEKQPIRATATKPVGSITKEEHERLVAAAVHSEHEAGSGERRKAVEAAIAATRDICVQEHAESVQQAVDATREECERDRAQAVEAAITGTRELCAMECDLHFFAAYAARAIRAKGKHH